MEEKLADVYDTLEQLKIKLNTIGYLITDSGKGISLDELEAYGLSLLIGGVADDLGVIQDNIWSVKKEIKKAA